MKFNRSSGQHFVASITHRGPCAGTLVVVMVGLAGLPVQERRGWKGGEELVEGILPLLHAPGDGLTISPVFPSTHGGIL